jgi:hypothetical protein
MVVNDEDNHLLKDFTTPHAGELNMGYIVPTVITNDFELKPALDVYSAKLIKYLNLYLISAASVRLSQVVVGVSNHKDNGELPVIASFTNVDNRTGVLY